MASQPFRRDAQAWGLTPREALGIALLPALAVAAFIAAVPFPGLFHWLIDEDSILETAQVVLLAATGGFWARIGIRLVRTGRPVLGGLYALLTLGSLFVAGEEISWGQRIFGWRTPPALEAINAQQEISLHNIRGMHQPFIYAVMLGAMYGSLVPLAAAWRPRWARPAMSYLLVPPLCLVPAFFVPFGYRLCRLILRPEQYVAPGYRVFVITEFSELTELSLYLGLAIYAWLSFARLRREPG